MPVERTSGRLMVTEFLRSNTFYWALMVGGCWVFVTGLLDSSIGGWDIEADRGVIRRLRIPVFHLNGVAVAGDLEVSGDICRDGLIWNWLP